MFTMSTSISSYTTSVEGGKWECGRMEHSIPSMVSLQHQLSREQVSDNLLIEITVDCITNKEGGPRSA